MNADRLMDALGKVKEAYIMECVPNRRRTKNTKIRWIAAAAAVVMILVFFQTAPGAAALEMIKETVTDVIEAMFPPKDIAVNVEGETEALPHEAGGQQPEIQQDGVAATPGYAIYYDQERYIMTEENGAACIRQIPVLPTRDEIRANNEALFEGLTAEEIEGKIDELLAQQEEFYGNLPACELEIVHLPRMQPANAAQTTRDEAAGIWEEVTEVMDSEHPVGYYFSASSGDAWDSPREQIYFTGDGQGGTFKISIRYFLEAAEGHGARLIQMLHTFEVIAP